jgi:hypothetical protein
MLSRAVHFAVDEAEGLPVSGDRGGLVVDESRSQADLLHRGEVEVRLDRRGLLGPCDPEPFRRLERLLQCSEAPSFVPSGVAE